MKKISYSKAKKTAIIFAILGIIIVILGICIGDSSGTGFTFGMIIIMAGCLVLLGTIIFTGISCRCHCCGGFLGIAHFTYCPHCGNPIKY